MHTMVYVLKHVWFSFERNMWQIWKKKPYKNETKKYKTTEREFFENYDNLRENEMNKKDNNRSLCHKWCYNQRYCALQRRKKKKKKKEKKEKEKKQEKEE